MRIPMRYPMYLRWGCSIMEEYIQVLLEQILNYFRTGKVPVSREETTEIFAFMKASNMSKERGGKPVSIEDAMREGEKDAKRLIKKYNK